MLREMSAPLWLDWLYYMTVSPSQTERVPYLVAQLVKAIWDAAYLQTTKGKKSNKRSVYDYKNEVRLGDEVPVLPPAPRRAGKDQSLKLHSLFDIIRATAPRRD